MPRILAIDHGTVRIGLALSDETEIVASPFKTIDATQEPERALARIVQEKRIAKIVIGMPYRMSGEKGSAAERVEKFALSLGKELQHSVPIEFVDERLSSVEAEASMSRAGITGKKERNEIVDQLAAVVILQEYLNQQRGPEGFLLPDASYELQWTDEPKRRRK
ncbi:Holliday junction resolvase RuvX [Prosthecobacter sp.]|uniref:Holliday junction resolvase RuvX n=1 Tax=Prosthecobacter sp. TaxID=1965333 RepID=UPI00248916E1|nr:Holliday junction resolvase RuvX [Prosthecobacter sp.]MDI1311667.1 Holliday junction resolvase RuvX [Prosthecobacter sp.]